MEELILYIVKALVNNPGAVSVALSDEQKNGMITYNLTVAEEDKGFVIGKHGKVAKALRAIVKTAAYKDGKKVHVYIV